MQRIEKIRKRRLVKLMSLITSKGSLGWRGSKGTLALSAKFNILHGNYFRVLRFWRTKKVINFTKREEKKKRERLPRG